MVQDKIAENGTPVRITVKAGCVQRGKAGQGERYIGTVEAGQTGLYLFPCPGKMGGEDWHVIAFGAWDVELHRSQFEIVG